MEKKIILLTLAHFRALPEFGGQLEAAAGDWEVLVTKDPAEIEKYLDRIEIGMGDIPAELIPRMPNFKWWQLWSAGADVLQKLPVLKTLPFQLTVAKGAHGQQISEHLFAMLLGWNHRLNEAYAAQRQRKWLFIKEDKIEVLAGKTMLIVGYGTIGGNIARLALSFGMKVIGLRRDTSRGGDAGVLLAPAEKLRDYLPQADYVVNILPITPDTRHYIGAGEFSLMKNSALYINVGRGATTCEADLVDALREKRIGGALLDVTETEPLPADSPLWDLENVILTGHYAGSRPGYTGLVMAIALDNLGRYKRGEPLKNLVDKQKGY